MPCVVGVIGSVCARPWVPVGSRNAYYVYHTSTYHWSEQGHGEGIRAPFDALSGKSGALWSAMKLAMNIISELRQPANA